MQRRVKKRLLIIFLGGFDYNDVFVGVLGDKLKLDIEDYKSIVYIFVVEDIIDKTKD